MCSKRTQTRMNRKNSIRTSTATLFSLLQCLCTTRTCATGSTAQSPMQQQRMSACRGSTATHAPEQLLLARLVRCRIPLRTEGFLSSSPAFSCSPERCSDAEYVHFSARSASSRSCSTRFQRRRCRRQKHSLAFHEVLPLQNTCALSF